MPLQHLYHQTKAAIDRVDFDALWPGFRPLKFALYDETSCFFDGAYIEKTAQFIANTSIEYAGEQIAIWQVQSALPPDVLASKIIHEMFHAFQTLQGWTSFPDEMQALRQYAYDADNLSVRLHENALLLRLADGFCAETYRALLACRAWRRAAFPEAYRYESCVEDVEGSASYVEWRALAQLCPEKAAQSLARMARTLQQPASFFPIRLSCYDTGALLFHAARMAGQRVEAPDARPLGLHMAQGVAPQPTKARHDDVARALHAYQADTRRIVDAALVQNDVVWDQPARLLCVNLYDARYADGYMTSRHFVLLDVQGREAALSGDFVIQLAGDAQIARIYRWSAR